MQKIEIDSFLDFQYVSAPEFSPCGKHAAFIVQKAALSDNKYNGDIYILDVETKENRRLTAAGDAKGFVWTKAGTLLFSANRDAKLKEKAQSGEALSIPCDWVVMAVGSRKLPFDAQGVTVPVLYAGDCSGDKTADIAAAIRGGYKAANSI